MRNKMSALILACAVAASGCEGVGCYAQIAQSVTPVSWTKVASEGASEAASPLVTLKAGLTYRFGAGTKWCALATPKADTQVRVWWSDMGCADPAPGVPKELDLLVVLIPTLADSPPVSAPSTPPAKTVVKTLTCSVPIVITFYSDGTTGITGSYTCPEKL